MDPSPPVGANWAEGGHFCTMVDRWPQAVLPEESLLHGEFWEDVHASWVRYKLKLPQEGGELHQEDTSRMKALWGHMLDMR